jgi:hypothetical protein
MDELLKIVGACVVILIAAWLQGSIIDRIEQFLERRKKLPT